jgi:aryl-alcohol dehydrogenase-like predicted oxidoreductase
VALNWVIHARGDIVVTIPGVTNAAQAAENAAAMKFRLSEAEMDELDELSKG